MLDLPTELVRKYEDALSRRGIEASKHGYYHRWLRFFLDYCRNCKAPYLSQESLAGFDLKLREKDQAEFFCRQAAHAVSIYWEMVAEGRHEAKEPPLAAPPTAPMQTSFSWSPRSA